MRRIILSLSCLFLSIAAIAQVGTQASLTGTVTDTSGAAIAGAQVSATNLATGVVSQAAADQHGNFDILALPIGEYSISAEAQGFKKWVNPHVVLTVGDRVRVAPVLQVGAITETVHVQGTSNLMQTESATVETVVQMQQIRELPLDTRNPLALVGLVPGMSYNGTNQGGFRDTFVQGQGLRNVKTNFQLDGLASTSSSSEGGTAVPNVDAVEEFNVQTLNAGAESGRLPSQVLVATKSGTNEFHGDAFEFNQNDLFSARNAFAVKKNRVRYNQFGGTLGGPVVKNKAFFFGSYQQTVIGNAVVFNSSAVTPAMENGDFSAISTPIINPYTHTPFPGNQIPQNMINPASKYFLPLFLTPNSPDGFFKANAKAPNTTYEYLARVDYQITNAQRIYGRFAYTRQPITVLGYSPSLVSTSTTTEPSLGITYNWTITNNMLLTLTGGFMRDGFRYTNPPLGKQNDSELAGIEGIPSTGREAWIGPPDINIPGYTGVYFSGGGYGAPGRQWGGEYNGKASLSYTHGTHAFSVGGEYFNRATYGAHGSAAPRGVFGFYNNYTGNGFADYLLGLTSSTSQNDPLTTFGETMDPILSGYGTDTWKITNNLTLTLGVRYDRFLSHKCYHNLCSIWDPVAGKTVVTTDAQGKPNFSEFPSSAGLAAATTELWETSQQAGYPRGLYEPNGHWEPRLGVTYRPFNQSNVVVRAGYGTYYNTFTGNRGASQINMPTWTIYNHIYGLNTLQDWRTAWAGGTSGATAPFNVYSPLVNIKPAKTEEWNVSIQTALPFQSALTLYYVGTRVPNEIAAREYNAATIGYHSNLQADLPHPNFTTIWAYTNLGRNWYNALQAKLERRFVNGLSFTMAYSWSKTMAQNLPDNCEVCILIPFSPDWYNRHVATFSFPQVESATLVWELPYGHGRRFGSNSGGFANTLFGGWQLSLLQSAHSGSPLEIGQSVANLGNGYGTRAQLVGNPHIAHRSRREWFNTSAFAQAPLYTFGNSGVGAVYGPGYFQINSGLSKSFYVGEARYFQFRWESYNLTNRVNYNNPHTSVNDSAFGQITGSNTARYMQFGLKFVF
jgi:hypothetical protein